MGRGLASVVLGLVLSSVGCGGCAPPVGTGKTGSVSGLVLKGPVEGATVTAYAVDDAGRRGANLGTATTDALGAYTVNIGGHSGALLLCSASGRYVEESNSALVQVGPLELCRLVDNVDLGTNVTDVIITPWTSLHAELASCFLELDREDALTGASSRATLRLGDFLGAGLDGYDLFKTTPVDVTTATGLSLSPEAWAGILSAGLSQTSAAISSENEVTPGVRFTAVTLADKLRADLAGGCLFDGVGVGGAVLSEGVVELSADTLRGAPQGLATGIAAFLTGDRNTSGITTDDVEDLLRVLAAHRSEIFADSTNETDLDKPVITFVAPDAGTTRGGVVRVEVTVTDASAVPTLEFTAPTQATFTSATPTCTTDAEAGTSCTLVSNLNTSLAPVEDGPVVVSVRAVDAAGNTQTADLNFVANNSLPTIQVTAPLNDPDDPAEGVVTISATAVDADGIESLTVEIPGVGLCSSEPGADLIDVEPATSILTCQWNTVLSPEGDVQLLFRARDAAGQQAEVPHVVVVDNVDVSSLAGFVDVGSPVANARVVALDWSGRVRGAVIAETTSDETGAYSLLLDDTQRASILVVATAGTYVDPASGLQLAMGTGQELTAAVAQLDAGEDGRLNLNAWTTLAAARATHTPVTIDDSFAITSNSTLLSRHLRRAPGAVFDVSQTRSADLALVITVANERAVLALSHAGLSRLAAEMSIAAGGSAVGTVTMTELVKALADDLRTDPLLDGKQGAAPITVGPALQALSSFTTRFDLAAALDRFVVEAPLPVVNVDRNGTGITRTDALGSLLYAHLAEDASPDLYPEDELPRPFDTSPPTIALTFGDSTFGRLFGEALSGNVVIDGFATDAESSVVDAFATLDGVDPLPDANNTPERLRLSIGTEIAPNVIPAIQACAEATQIDDAAALGDGVCVCALAEDENDNVGEALLCFTRPEPVIVTAQPAPGTVINATASTALTTTVTSGFDLATCTVALTHQSASSPPLNAPSKVGPSCTFAQSLAPSALADGTWALTTTARDIADRSVTLARSFVVDTTPPTVTVTSPALGTVSNATAFTMTGTVAGTGDLESIRVTESSFGDITVPLAPNATTWSVPLDGGGNLIVDGVFNFSVTARDVNGNERQIAHSYVVDTSAPSISFAPSQPDIVSYASDQPIQPTGTLTCPATGVCIDKRSMAIGAAAARISHATLFTSAGAPAQPITRWENLLDSLTDVPQVRIASSDSNGSQVRFALSPSCSATPTRTAIRVSESEFRIELRESNFLNSLASQTGATTFCLVAEAVDNAGNVSFRITKNFRWKTIAPPVPVTMAPASFSTDRVYPGGVPDASNAFKGTKLELWARGAVGQYGILHGFLHNPYSVPVRASVKFTGGSTMTMSIKTRLREVWTTGSAPPHATETPLGQNDGGILRNPCNLFADQTSPSTPRPIWTNNRGLCQTSQPSLFQLTSWSGASAATTVVNGFLSRTQLNAPRPATKTDVLGTVPSPVSISLNQVVLFYAVDAAGTPLNQVTQDAQGVLTIAPNTSLLWVITASNATLGPTLTFHNNRSTIDTAATSMFFGAPPQNQTLPRVTISNTVFIDRVNSVPVKPAVFIWSQNTSGTNGTDDFACDNNECAIGLRWTQVDSILAARGSPSQTLILRTRIGSAAEQDTTWSTTTTFPSSARTVSAPISPLP